MMQKPIILYIEDDGLLMNMYRNLFTLHGFGFLGARDFESGKQLIAKKNPDLILLDLLLPSKAKWLPSDLNVELGLELLSQLKASPRSKNTPVIVLTNMDESLVEREAKKRGADEFMVKANVVPKDVLIKVRGILGKRGLELPDDPGLKAKQA